MKFSHLLVMVALSGTMMLALTAIDSAIEGPKSSALFLIIVPVMVIAAFLAEPVARRLHLPPLTTLWGPCPACGRRPSGWWSSPVSSDLLHLQCGECGQRVDLWLIKPQGSVSTTDDVPTYALRHPRFLGMWRRLRPPQHLFQSK